ncbi:hypothetical protein [Methylobacterium sp. 13MFTsu3.1M2]|uniref:hypothetical protein n=1 Tax=Methylobacterium sp. 13MFTsu3.1M2 TaxID=1502776 RepID=UPI0008EE0DDF|nr:hypothetical protein [Methylobacterium sp. 13MFTsu3.1M2]SFD96502.1 hypothetical protein SAMN02799627_02182 [Methylobacterium sp. 13MFTsu3.1M2]
MPGRLRPPPVPDAREPLAALRPRGWMHAGTIPLDGILMARGSAGPDWRARLLPWLEHAAEVRSCGDRVLVLFAAPVTRDCAALGPVLPVVRSAGILTAVPLAEPEPPVAAALRDHVVHMTGGRLAAEPLAAFASLDIAGWWDLDAIAVHPAERLPVLRPAPPARRLVSAPALVADADPLAPVRDAATRRPRRRTKHVLGDLVTRFRRLIGGALGLLWTAYVVLLASIMVGAMVLGFAENVRTTAEQGAAAAHWGSLALPVLVLLVLAWFAFRRRGARAAREGAAPSASPPAGTGSGRTPIWRRAAAWLAWRSPYAAHLRRLYARRLTEVERLFAAGRVDEALYRAIGLGGAARRGSAFADLPLTGPGLRRSLDFDLGPQRASGLSLAPADEIRLAALYRAQAVAMAGRGDTDRAAFVLDSLVGNPHEAVRLLAESGRLETAARLAEARRLPPATTVPLWFRAGQTERALALAARHEAHAELWKELGADDPFRPVLAEAWAARLVGIGALDRAAAVTFGLPALAERRLDWIRQALDAETPVPAAPLARALRALPWEGRDGDRLHAAFADLVSATGAEAAARRSAVAALLLDAQFEGGPERPPTPAFALLCRGLARRLAADDGILGHDAERARLAGRLAEAGGQVALRQHLRQLRTRSAPAASRVTSPLVVPDGPALAEIADAALLSGGRLLLGYRSGLVRLLGRAGRERWRGQVDGLTGFARLGAGDRALVLRETLEGPDVQLFDAGTGRLLPLGPLPITHWHGQADETGWLVFDGEALVRLDTASLLGRAGGAPGSDGALAHHWRLPMTEPGRPLLLAAFADASTLIYARHDGLIEWWCLSSRTLAVTCRFWTPPDRGVGVLGLTEAVAWSLEGTGAHPHLRAHPHAFTTASREQERALIEAAARAEPADPPRLVAAENGRLWAATATEEGTLWASVPGANRIRGPAVLWQGSGSLRARFAPEGDAAAVFDGRGRLIVFETVTGQVILRLI